MKKKKDLYVKCVVKDSKNNLEKYLFSENERLNAIIDELEEEKAELEELYENSEWWHNRFNAVQRDYENLQQRIDKAIEYIKEHQEKQFAFNFEYALRDNEIDALLEILGDKENE